MKFNSADEFTRRELMIKMAKASFGISLAPMFGNSVATAADFVPNRPRSAKSIIFLMMSGGMSHLDTWDVKPGNTGVMGETKIIEALVIADSPAPVPPCGGCRQKLAEFAGKSVKITLCTTDGKSQTLTVGDLLPGQFDASHMDRA